MNAKHGWAGAVLVVLMAGPLALAQTPLNLSYPKESAPTPRPDAPSTALPPTEQPYDLKALAPDTWVYQQQQPRVDCCGPIGSHGPIGTDLYVRSGASFLVSDTPFASSLRTGYEVMAGGRSLFYNPEGSRAWVVDVGVSYTYNDGHPDSTFIFNGNGVTLRGLTRGALSVGLGHDWILLGPGYNNCDCNLRFGVDGGGRVGTSHLDMNLAGIVNGYVRTHDNYWAGYAAIHADLEIPMGAWSFVTGARGEWDYSGLNLPIGTTTGLNSVNVLLYMGVRY